MKKILITFLLLFLLIGLGGYYYFQKHGAPQEPKLVKITKVKLSDIKLPPNMTVMFNAEAHLKNENPFSLNISGMDFDVYVNGKKATHINQDMNSKMPANSDFMLPIRFEIPLKNNDSFKGIGELLKGTWKKKAIDIRSEGTISVKALKHDFHIPFDYEDEYKLSDYF